MKTKNAAITNHHQLWEAVSDIRERVAIVETKMGLGIWLMVAIISLLMTSNVAFIARMLI